MPISLPQVPFKLNPEDMGSSDVLSALQKGLNLGQQAIQFPEDMKYKMLQNIIQKAKADVAPQREQADLKEVLAKTFLDQQQGNKLQTMTPLEAIQQQKENEWYDRKAQADINYKNMGGAGAGVGVKELNAISNQIRNENPNFSPEQIIDARNAYLEGRNSLSDGTPLPPVSGAMNALVNQSYKRGTDVGQRAQERYANTLETTFKNADTVAPGAFKFASAAGKVRGGVEKLKAQRGENDPDYKDYLIFTRQVMPALASEIIRTGGASSTDTQKALAIQQANPITWDNNPELAMQQYKFLKSLYRDIGKTITAGPSKTHSALMKASEDENQSSGKKRVTYNPSTGEFE